MIVIANFPKPELMRRNNVNLRLLIQIHTNYSEWERIRSKTHISKMWQELMFHEIPFISLHLHLYNACFFNAPAYKNENCVTAA